MTGGFKDQKKLIALGVLGVVLAVAMYINVFSGPSVPSNPAQPAASTAPGRPGAEQTAGPMAMASAPSSPKASPRARPAGRGRSEEFHPVYLSNRPEERPDPTKIDPTLRLDLFSKVQSVDAAGGRRNLFAFGAPPPPPKAAELPKGPETRVTLGAAAKNGPATPSLSPTTPPDIPLKTNLKYYGIVALSHGGKKTACFLDTGDEILLGTEGDTLKRRYRVMKISPASVVIQDTESKKEETIPLAKEAQG